MGLCTPIERSQRADHDKRTNDTIGPFFGEFVGFENSDNEGMSI